MANNLEKKQYYEFIAPLRLFALVLACYPHLTAILNPEWEGLQYSRWFFALPLGLVNEGGSIGVPLFLIISGFLLARDKNKPFPFLIKKFIQLYLPIPIVVAVFFVFQWQGKILFSYVSWWDQFTLTQWIQTMTLTSFLRGQGDQINGILWYMIPQLTAFLLYFIARLMRIPKKAYPLFMCAAMLALYYLNNSLPNGVSSSAPYMCCLVAGFLLAQLQDGEIDVHSYALQLFVVWVVVLIGAQKFGLNRYPDYIYTIAMVMAYLLFIIFLLIPNYRCPEWVKTCGKYSFYFYLCHSIYGGWMISLLMNVLPFDGYLIPLILGIGISAAAAYLYYAVIDQMIIRGLLRIFIKQK